MEIFLKEGKFVTQEEWSAIIDELRNTSGNVEIRKRFENAVETRIPSEHFGIMFSGGVDSSLIALVCRKKCKKEQFTGYSVGFKTEGMDMPPDLAYAQRVAEAIDIDLKIKIFDIEEAEEIIKKAVSILPRPKNVDADYVVKVGVASVVIAVNEIANDNIFFSGLGSEELFAGYDRHSKVDDVNEECWRGLKAMWNRDLVRDCAVADALQIGLLTPFLDKELIVNAMRIPGDMKINEQQKKIILRAVAEEIGLPKEFAWRKKQGAQYGSRFDRALDKLAKKNGLKYKREYLEHLISQSV